MQHDGLGAAMVTRLGPLLSSSAASTAPPADTAATIARCDQHIMALHALAALLAADVSGTLGGRLRSAGALAAVLESLGTQTERRLLAPAQFQLQNFRLVEAHLLLLQVSHCVAMLCWLRTFMASNAARTRRRS
jgi:hypothetical protein